MKRIRFLILLSIILLAVLTLTACEDNRGHIDIPMGHGPAVNIPGGGHEDEPDKSGEGEPQVSSVFFFKMGNVIINMDQDMAELFDKIGEPLGIQPNPNCVFGGEDKIIGYPGIEIFTYQLDNIDRIYLIDFRDDNVRTAEGGINLGSSIDAVIAVYGNDYQFDTGMYTFTRGMTTLQFLVEDDHVVKITYRLLQDM